jgi:hypothetical protein
MKKIIILLAITLGFGTFAEAQQRSEPFYLQHSNSNNFAVPYWGRVKIQSTIQAVPDPATPRNKGEFYFVPKEGGYGLIVSAYDENRCLCPYTSPGWRVRDLIKQSKWKNHSFVIANPKGTTYVGFSSIKTQACYWKIDQKDNVIIHKSGAYMMAPNPSGKQNIELVYEADIDKTVGKSATNFVTINTNSVKKGVKGEKLILNLRSGPVLKVIPAVGNSWIDIPTGKITKIQVIQEGGSITTDIGESVGINLSSEKKNSQSSSSSTTLNSEFETSVSNGFPLGPKVEAKFSLGLSATQTSEISKSITEQTLKSLKNSKNWQTRAVCPKTSSGHVRFAITEQVIRVRENPMSIAVDGKAPIYIQEAISYTQVNFTQEYAMGSPEIKRKWDEFKRENSQLLSEVEENEYINTRKQVSKNEPITSTFYGDFSIENPQNGWHEGTISSDVTNKNGKTIQVLKWTNKAGKEWNLEIEPEDVREGEYVILNTDKSNPYYSKGFAYRTFKFMVDEQGQVKGFYFGSGYYKRVSD